MYVTGNIIDFGSRLHQLPTTTGDLATFKTEVSGYWSTYTPQVQQKLQTEAQKKIIEFGYIHSGIFSGNYF